MKIALDTRGREFGEEGVGGARPYRKHMIMIAFDLKKKKNVYEKQH